MRPSSSSSTPGRDEAIEALAAAWLAQRDGGFTLAEAEEFVRWQQADPRHAAAVARLDRSWHLLQELRDYRPDAQAHPDRDLLARRRRPADVHAFPFRAALASLAAAAAVVLTAAWWWGRVPSPTENLVPRAPVYATTADGYQRVTLEDGSVLELNASSAVRIEFVPAERHVTLLRGEAHFTVAKNKARPFVVEANHVSVRAVGTAFDVRLDSKAVEVLVTEGKVSVQQKHRLVPAPALGARAAPGETFLTAGQRLAVTTVEQSADEPKVEPLSPETVRETLAWQGPRLRFVDTPLAEVVAQFNRRNQVQIELADARLTVLPVDGSFRAENVEAFVRLLESNGCIVAERTGSNRIILHRAPARRDTGEKEFSEN